MAINCLRTLPSRTSVNPLVLQLDFGQLDSNVISRPLVIKISEYCHRNDKRPDNCYCEWFHQGILQFAASPDPCHARPGERGRATESMTERRHNQWRQSR